MIYEKFAGGDTKAPAYTALSAMLDNFDESDEAYVDVIRYRMKGGAIVECNDFYFVAHENGVGASRLWYGWGKHKDSVGNWGHVYTDEAYRGKGHCGRLLNLWYDDFKQRTQLPLCFLCWGITAELVALYGKFGFVPAIDGKDTGPLYLPVGDSPKSFRQLCESYYRPSDYLIHKKATLEYRHEVDCLLRFALYNEKLNFSINGNDKFESLLVHSPERLGMLFSSDGHCVGWSLDGQAKVYPMYDKCEIINGGI